MENPKQGANQNKQKFKKIKIVTLIRLLSKHYYSEKYMSHDKLLQNF